MNTHDIDPIAEQLAERGYQPEVCNTTVSDAGRTEREYEIQTFRPILDASGERRDWAEHCNLAVVSFEFDSVHGPDRYSNVAARFADAVVSLFDSSDGPLIRRIENSLQVAWRLEARVFPQLTTEGAGGWRPLFEHGLKARDAGRFDTLVLCAGCPYISTARPDAWLADRSPFTVSRADLPEWDGDAVSAALEQLVDKAVKAGDLQVCGRYLEPARVSTDSEHDNLDRTISTDPADWDPTDPRRKSPGLIARVRALREKIMGQPSHRIDNDELQGKLEQRRAARSPGIYAPWLD